MDRRDFIKSAAVATVATAGTSTWAKLTDTDKLNVAFIGVGRQGLILLDQTLSIPGITVQAVCDIWEYRRRTAQARTRRHNPKLRVYDDYTKLLDAESSLDAVVIATPDNWHASITVACLRSGLHVYCEKAMAHTLDAAAGMVRTQRATGKLLQIGHQRRSNPFYQHAYRLMHTDRFFGEITAVAGQWRQRKPLYPLPRKLVSKYAISQATLEKWGYANMTEFYEWRWFKSHSGGPMSDLGSLQVNVFNWFLNRPPSRVIAFGGIDHGIHEAERNKTGFVPECFDHTIAHYEWSGKNGPVRGVYDVNLISSHGGFFETFMGDKGSMTISEFMDRSAFFREKTSAPSKWEDQAVAVDSAQGVGYRFDPVKSRKAKGRRDRQTIQLEQALTKDVHLLHLENFFDAIRGKTKLTCPAEIGYETAVSVLKANESAVTGKAIEFKPEDFNVS